MVWKESVSYQQTLKKIKPTSRPRFLSADVSGPLNMNTSKKITRRRSDVCPTLSACECVCILMCHCVPVFDKALHWLREQMGSTM